MTILKLDLDGKGSFSEFLSRCWILKGFGIRPERISVYDTANGYHVYLSTEVILTPELTLFLQAILGSDYRKEVFSWFRLERGHSSPNWNVLYEKKWCVNKVGDIEEVGEEVFNKELQKKSIG